MNYKLIAKRLRAMAEELDGTEALTDEMRGEIEHYYCFDPSVIANEWNDETENERSRVLEDLGNILSFLDSLRSNPNRDEILRPVYEDNAVYSFGELVRVFKLIKGMWENRDTGMVPDSSLQKLIESKFGKDSYALRDFMNDHCKNCIHKVTFAVEDGRDVKYVFDDGSGPEICEFFASDLKLPQFQEALEALKAL